MNKKEQYDQWVERVCEFIEKVGPQIGKHPSVFQSKPILDKQLDVVFIGYNAHEDFSYSGVDKERFYNGNPSFYTEERNKWPIWIPLKGMFMIEAANYPAPVTDGKFVLMNAVFFGSQNIAQLKAIPGSRETISKCLDFTGEVIQDIFKPKCIVCLSIPDCFNNLHNKYKFSDIQFITPKMENNEDASVKVKKGLWGNIPVYGIPHPSGRVSWNNWGSIALFLKKEMQKLGIE